ncbi:MAG: hypothetical protein JWL59_4211 [Chthoniobacteraceae bacterium]|nr:hypothetical protein [Chthoniobacteraceae bacterium]
MKSTLRIRVVPNAKRSEVAGVYGEAVRIKIAAPALDGKANEALREFLARRLDLPGRAITLISGEKSRDKIVAIEGVEPAELRIRLLDDPN